MGQPPKIDLFLNPTRQREKNLAEAFMLNITRDLFNPPLPRSSYPHLFRLLRHTNLPCMPSGQDQGNMILRCIAVFINFMSLRFNFWKVTWFSGACGPARRWIVPRYSPLYQQIMAFAVPSIHVQFLGSKTFKTMLTNIREEGCDDNDVEDMYACMVRKLQMKESQACVAG